MGSLVWEPLSGAWTVSCRSPSALEECFSVRGAWPELFQMVRSGVGGAEHGREGSTGRGREACLEAAALVHTKDSKA